MAAFRVTYATLSADDDELQASYTPPSRRPGARGVPSAPHRSGDSDGDRSPPARRSTRRRGGGFPRPRPPTSTTPSPRRRGAAMVVDAVAGAGAILDRVADLISERSVDHAAHWRGRTARPPRGTRRGRRSSRPDPLLHARDGRARRLRRADGAVQRGRGDHRRDAAVRRLGGHRAVQLSGRARRRAGGRRTRRRQHGRHQAVRDRLVVRTPHVRRVRRRRRAARRRQPRDRRRPGGRRARRRQPARRAHVHRFERRRDVDHPRLLVVAPEAGDLRDGWQEPGDRRRVGRSRAGGRGHGASAFGFGGQKCSAASRVFVHESLVDEFVDRLVARAEPSRGSARSSATGSCRLSSTRRRSSATTRSSPTPGSPARCCAAGPAHRRRLGAATSSRHRRARARRLDDLGHRAVRAAHRRPFRRFARRGARAGQRGAVRVDGRSVRRRRSEIDRFLDRIEAGVVYVNRSAGATTGAWPGVQPFGGWKRSGTAGKAGGGPYYLQQYLREQSRTIVVDRPPQSAWSPSSRGGQDVQTVRDAWRSDRTRSTGRPGAVWPSTPVTVSATNRALATDSSVASTTAVKMSFREASPTSSIRPRPARDAAGGWWSRRRRRCRRCRCGRPNRHAPARARRGGRRA